MSLRRALLVLSDDASTRAVVHGLIAFMDRHRNEPLDMARLSRATGLGIERIEPVVRTLVDALVVDCDGDPTSTTYTFAPDTVLELEVRRFLRSGDGNDRLHRSIDRYRGRFGSSV